MRNLNSVLCFALLMSCAAFATNAARAQDADTEKMVRSLQAKPGAGIVRGIELDKSSPSAGVAPAAPSMADEPRAGAASPSPPAPPSPPPPNHDLANQLRTMPSDTRQITVEQRKKVADTVEEQALPAIDVEVFFAYDSSVILPEALPKLMTLGRALSDSRLEGSLFLIGGHTDAKGSNAYNLQLSGERAGAVKRFLVQNFHIAPETLMTLGFGEERLKDPQDPFGGENRRVQVVNIEAAPVAQQ